MDVDKILEKLRLDRETLILLGVIGLGAWFVWLLPVAPAEKLAAMVIGGLLTAYKGRGPSL